MRQYFAILLLCSIIGCKETEEPKVAAVKFEAPYVNPPNGGKEIPFQVNTVDAGTASTLRYPSGSYILFPAGAFVDSLGKEIIGNVDVKFREFQNPVDFYFSGIPMNYDSSGKSFQFESSGMCEILAFKDGFPVFVNPNRQPQLNLLSSNKEIRNFYFLDTINRRWKYMGQNTIITSESSTADVVNIIEEVPMPEGEERDYTLNYISQKIEEPVKPARMDNSAPVFEILIEPNSFRELAVYNNLKFQLVDEGQTIDPKDVQQEWTNVEILKAESKGIYSVKFSNYNKTLTLKARPVFEGKDYDEAMKVFEVSRQKYEELEAARLESEKRKEQELMESIARKKREKVEARKKLDESQKKIIEKDNAVVAELNKSFSSLSINSFGIFNCDRPTEPYFIPVESVYMDENNNPMLLREVGVINRSFNSIVTYPKGKIQLVSQGEHMIIGVSGRSFAYYTYDEFNAYNKERKEKGITGPYIFKMRVVSNTSTYYDDLKALAGIK